MQLAITNMTVEKKYYSNIEDNCANDSCNNSDLPKLETVQPRNGVTRKSFLKTVGFSFGALMVACSKAPVKKAIPFLIQPEEVLPGKALWYASTSFACDSGCAVHVKNRDGRPIKLEGNPSHPINQGGLCSQCQASLLGLYDSKRILKPEISGKSCSWEKIDNEIINELNEIKESSKEIVILSNTISSPSTYHQIKLFKKKFGDVRHIQIDDYSYSAILDAHEKNYSKRLLPQYHFDKANVIVSIDADFLGSWISPTQFTKDFQKNRNLTSEKISKLFQIESHLSLTGAKADERIVLSPSGILKFIEKLDATIQGESSDDKLVNKVAKSLLHNKGKSLVVCGVNDIDVQVLINRINQKLNNINKTIDHRRPSLQYSGSDIALNNFLDDIDNSKIGGIIIFNSNPIYTLPQGIQLSESIKKVKLNVSISNYNNETSNICKYVVPAPHDLESWNDSELISGLLSMTQPVVQSLGDTRSFRKSLSVWSGAKAGERDLVRNYWKQQYKSRIGTTLSFSKFWNKLVHDGFARIKPFKVPLKAFMDSRPKLKIEKSNIEFSLYQTPHLAMGRHAENPWLQELPNPITKITWDNYASISDQFADKNKLNNGDLINVQTKMGSVTLPVFIQPGQQDNTISMALGYGRIGTERFHSIGPDWLEKKPTINLYKTVGESVSNLINYSKSILYFGIVDKVKKEKGSWDLAQTQTYDTLKNPIKTAPASMPIRPFIQETNFKSFKKDSSSGSHHTHPVTTMWSDDHKYEGHHWGMAIDISACTGCSSCVVSCQAENNIPVVGKDEVLRKRDMAWLRLDRYYSGEGENVDVAFQAMMCQHCDNAPCEPVCPVLATVHSTEGLNQQVYNRCVGTRFCANNCPYKVRRFNWFDYAHEDVMENMVLNPDVTVRSRGVMEKCSMCIQRIQEVRIEARKNGEKIKDGQIKMACEQSCPADAIVFGDLNDPESKISRLVNSGRHYRVLEELNIQPTVGYLTQVRNREKKSTQGNHHG